MKTLSNFFHKSRKEILRNKYLRNLKYEDTLIYLNSLNKFKFSFNNLDFSERPLIQPRGGFSSIPKQQKLNIELEKAGADIIPLTIDSFTRLNDYEGAEKVLIDENKLNKEILNGYPLVNHGYEKTREILSKVNLPVSLRHGTADARILVEHALASGITDIEGGGLSYCLPYSRKIPVEKSLLYWGYVDELCSFMSTNKKLIMRESFGVLTATLVPPLIIIIVEVLELLMSAQKGIKAFMMTFAQTGSLVQDIVISNVLRVISKKYLSKYDFNLDVLKIGYHHWMGPFPHNFESSNALIIQGTLNAALIKADKVIIKTKFESHSIPTIEANCEATKSVKYMLDIFKIKDTFTNEEILIETNNLVEQAECVLDNILKNKNKIDIIDICDAVNNGWVDIPFSPHPQNKNKVKTYRDHYGMVRFSDYGNLPLTDYLKEKDLKILSNNKDLLKNNNIIQAINWMVN